MPFTAGIPLGGTSLSATCILVPPVIKAAPPIAEIGSGPPAIRVVKLPSGRLLAADTFLAVPLIPSIIV